MRLWIRQRFLRFDTKRTRDKQADKLEFVKIKNICSSKDTIKKVKNTTHRMGENFGELFITKGFVSTIYKEL